MGIAASCVSRAGDGASTSTWSVVGHLVGLQIGYASSIVCSNARDPSLA